MRNSIAVIALAGATLAGSIAFTSGARAEPQVLALVATGGAIELDCRGAECGAEFTTFCLEFERFSPARGTAYRPLEGGELRLVGTTAEGHEVSLDVGRYLRFESARSHLAMRISIERRHLESLGLERVTVVVGENVSLLPDSAPGRAEAREGQELELISGPLRRLGGALVDANPERMIAARITNRLINSLPVDEPIGAEAANALWRQAVIDAGEKNLAGGAVDMARGAIDLCNFLATRGGYGSLRQCLQSKHDGFVGFLNSKYWKAVRTGS